MFHTKGVEKIKAHFTFFFENCAEEITWKYTVQPGSTTGDYGAWALHAGYLRLQTPTQNMLILIAFPLQQWLANAPQCHIIRTLPDLLNTHSVAITCVHLGSYFYIPCHFTLLVYQATKTKQCILNPRYTVQFSCIKRTLTIVKRLLGKQSLRHTVHCGVRKRQYKRGNSREIKCEIWGSHDGYCEDLLTFRKYLQHPFSGKNHYSHIIQIEIARSFNTLVNF